MEMVLQSEPLRWWINPRYTYWQHIYIRISWPYLEPYVELEGDSEEAVKAVFGAADQVISRKYKIPENAINNEIPRIVFIEPNPYLAWKEENKK
jgi:hypothetical protein